MATQEQLLALIPEGGKYAPIRNAITKIASTFPGELPEITPDRLAGWVAEIDGTSEGVTGTARDADQIRDDIFRVIVGTDVIMQTLGVDAATADDLLLGSNDGGINFSDLVDGPGGLQRPEVDDSGILGQTEVNVGGGTDEGSGTSAVDIGRLPGDVEGAETQTGVGVGGREADRVSIVSSATLEWAFDTDTGKWFASYKLPNSDRRIFYEATGGDLDAIFGDGRRPAQFTSADDIFTTLTNEQTFAGDIGEVHGTGSFESNVKRVITLALDEGVLPQWAQNDPAVTDLLYIKVAEEKSDEWLVDNIAKLDSFKARFPQLGKIQATGLNVTESVTAFLEFEVGVKQILVRENRNPANLDPNMVGDMLAKGQSLSDVDFVFTQFKTLRDNEGAFDAFNAVLAARGLAPLSRDDQLDFLAGTSTPDIYQIWEESSFARAADEAGLNITVGDAMRLARRTDGFSSFDQALEGLQTAAGQILRFRQDIDLQRYDIDQEDLIDLSQGITPRSGRTQAQVGRNMERALAAAQAGTTGPRAQRFRQFTQEGVPQGVSTSRARTRS